MQKIEKGWWMCYSVRRMRTRSDTLYSILKMMENCRDSLCQYQSHLRLVRGNLCKDSLLSTICHVILKQVRNDLKSLGGSMGGGSRGEDPDDKMRGGRVRVGGV